MTAARDELRRSLAPRNLTLGAMVGISGVVAACVGVAVALHDVFDPDPLLGWRIGLFLMAGGLAVASVEGLLHRRRFFALADRKGVSRTEAQAIWDEPDGDDA